MKSSKMLLFVCCTMLCIQLSAQNTSRSSSPLVGTWMERKDSVEEIKIFSPSHVFFIVRNLKGDVLATGAGTYDLTETMFSEKLQYANFETKGIKSDYNYQVKGENLTQVGTLVLADGTQVPIDHTFSRVKAGKGYDGPHVGTWNQVSSTFRGADGTQGAHTNATHIRYQIITPTHWMRISTANGKFENAFGGTYTLQGDQVIPKIEYGTQPENVSSIAIKQKIDGNRMLWNGVMKNAQGQKVFEWEDVFERVAQ